MQIETTELEKIERLLESKDQKNIDLALTILSGFAVDDEGSDWLFSYYQKLEHDFQQNDKGNLQSILLGTTNLSPTKASRILTMLFENSSESSCIKILKSFHQDSTMTIPRLELPEFPECLITLPNIEHISWQYGSLTHLSDIILEISNLQSLDLRHQPLLTIDEKIIQHTTLKELWIGNALIVTENLVSDANFDIFIEAAY